jgi:hypothetical protein
MLEARMLISLEQAAEMMHHSSAVNRSAIWKTTQHASLPGEH